MSGICFWLFLIWLWPGVLFGGLVGGGRSYLIGALILFLSMPASLVLEKNGVIPSVYPLSQAICDFGSEQACSQD